MPYFVRFDDDYGKVLYINMDRVSVFSRYGKAVFFTFTDISNDDHVPLSLKFKTVERAEKAIDYLFQITAFDR